MEDAKFGVVKSGELSLANLDRLVAELSYGVEQPDEVVGSAASIRRLRDLLGGGNTLFSSACFTGIRVRECPTMEDRVLALVNIDRYRRDDELSRRFSGKFLFDEPIANPPAL